MPCDIAVPPELSVVSRSLRPSFQAGRDVKLHLEWQVVGRVMPDREHTPSRLAAPAVLACLQLEALDMQSLLDGSDPVGIIVGLEHEDVGERARYATAQLLGSPVRISAKQVGELRSEHVRREQGVLLGTW